MKYQSTTIAAFWMLGTLSSFMLMAVAGRELSFDYSTFQILFWRSLVGLLVIFAIMGHMRSFSALKTPQFGKHCIRNFIHYGGQYGWFLGLSLLPLAQVFAIEFTTPLWTVLLGVLFFNERVSMRRVCAVLLGFAGILTIVRPGFIAIDYATLVVLGAALCYATTYLMTKKLTERDSAITILFYMCLLQLPIGFAGSLDHWLWPTGIEWLWIFLVGVSALSAHYCLATALSLADATVVVPMDFLRLPMSAVLGYLLYTEIPDIWLIPGAMLILVGVLFTVTDAQKRT